MILAIDIGNTNIVIGCIDNDEIRNEVRIASDPLKTADQYAFDLKNMLQMYDVSLQSVEGAIISSVVPLVQTAVSDAVTKLTGIRPMVVGPGIKTGLNVHIDDPRQAGADLIVAAVGAMQEYPLPLILIDMGTATTITVVDRTRSWIGGCICPGVVISADALTSHTALLPGVGLETPKKAIGSNTIDCIRSGLILGTACMIDGMIERMEQELGEPATVVATGGTAKYVLPLCRRTVTYEENLLVKGLMILYKNNHR